MNNLDKKLADNHQLKLPGIRQLASALLVTIILCSVIGYLIIHQQKIRNNQTDINPVVIPSVIKPKVIASNPRSEENYPLVFPLRSAGQ